MARTNAHMTIRSLDRRPGGANFSIDILYSQTGSAGHCSYTISGWWNQCDMSVVLDDSRRDLGTVFVDAEIEFIGEWLGSADGPGPDGEDGDKTNMTIDDGETDDED